MSANGDRDAWLREALAISLNRQEQMEALIQRLFTRVEEQQILLNSALHDLAAAKKEPRVSTASFISQWYRKRGARL